MPRFNSQTTLLNAVTTATTSTPIHVANADAWTLTCSGTGSTGAVTITVSATNAATSTGSYVSLDARTISGTAQTTYSVNSQGAGYTYVKIATSTHTSTRAITASINLVADRENY